MIRAQVIRSLILSSFLFLSVITSHHLAGGEIVNISPLCLISIAAFVFFSVKFPKSLEGPKLAALLLIFQLVGHFILNTNSTSDIKMFFSHAFALYATYKFIEKIDFIETGLFEFFSKIILPIKLHPIQLTQVEIEIYFEYQNIFTFRVLRNVIQGQAPPFRSCA